MEGEINGCQQQLELTKQTIGNLFCVQVLKGKRELPYTLENNTNSDRKQFAKTGTGSVDEVSARSRESHSSIPNSVSSVKGKTHIEKSCVQFCKKEVAVQLKRVDEYIRKLDDTVVSKPANESLDYKLYEDIIVVNNESDIENASSQMFIDQKPSVELLKAEGYDAAHEEFHKVVEGVDESLLEDDDIEFDDDLFKKL